MSNLAAIAAAAGLELELAAVGLSAWVVSAQLARETQASALRVMLFVLLAATQIIVTMLILGMIGIASFLAVAGVSVAAALLLVARYRDYLPFNSPAGLPSIFTVGAGFVFAFLQGIMGILRSSTESDTLRYHLPHAAHWLQSSSWTIPFDYPGSYYSGLPGNAELVGTWLMLPSHTAAFVYVAPVLYGALVVTAGAALGVELGGSAAAGALAALALVTSPIGWGQAVSLESDLGTAGAGVVAAVLAVRAMHEPGRGTWPFLAGVASGLALGSKVTAAPTAAVVGLLLLAMMPRGRRFAAAARYAAGLVLLAGFWPVRNLLAFGNPLYPQGISLVGFTLRGSQSWLLANAATMLHWILPPNWELIGFWAKLVALNYGPMSLLAVAGLVAPIFYCRRMRGAGVFVGLVASVSFLGYLVTPLSGGLLNAAQNSASAEIARTAVLGSDIRFAMVVVAMASILAITLLPKRIGLTVLFVALAYNMWNLAQPDHLSRAELSPGIRLTALAVILAGLCLVALYLRPQRPGPMRPVIRVLAAAAIAAIALAVLTRAAVRVPALDQVELALNMSSRPGGPVAVVDVADVGNLLGPRFSRHLVTVGRGASGREEIIGSAAEFAARLQELDPAVVVVGGDPTSPVSSRPVDWTPPNDWVLLGREGNGEVYLAAPKR